MSVENEAASAAIKLGVDALGGVIRAGAQVAGEVVKSAASIVTTIPKNTAAFIQALVTRTDSAGRVSIARVMQGGEKPMVFELDAEQYKQFKKEAKHLGVTYGVYTDKTTPGTDIICRASEADLVNHLLHKIGYGQVELVDETQTPATVSEVRDELRAKPELEAVARVEILHEGRVIYSAEYATTEELAEFFEASRNDSTPFNVVLYKDADGRHIDPEPLLEELAHPEIANVSYEDAPKPPEPAIQEVSAEQTIDAPKRPSWIPVGRVDYIDEWGDITGTINFYNEEELVAAAKSDAWFGSETERSQIAVYFSADNSHHALFDRIAAEVNHERTAMTFDNPRSPEGAYISSYGEFGSYYYPNPGEFMRGYPERSGAPPVGYLVDAANGERVAYYSAELMVERYGVALRGESIPQFEVVGNDSAAMTLNQNLSRTLEAEHKANGREFEASAAGEAAVWYEDRAATLWQEERNAASLQSEPTPENTAVGRLVYFGGEDVAEYSSAREMVEQYREDLYTLGMSAPQFEVYGSDIEAEALKSELNRTFNVEFGVGGAGKPTQKVQEPASSTPSRSAQRGSSAASQKSERPRRNAREAIAEAKTILAERAAAQTLTKEKTAAPAKAAAPKQQR